MGNFSSIGNDKDVIVIMFGALRKKNFYERYSYKSLVLLAQELLLFPSQRQGKQEDSSRSKAYTVSLSSSIHRISKVG